MKLSEIFSFIYSRLHILTDVEILGTFVDFVVVVVVVVVGFI